MKNEIDIVDHPHPISPNHTAAGKFAPGNRANVAGRPTRERELAVLSAISAALPPDKLQKALEDAMTWAYEYKSPKMVLALAQFAVGYMVGKPVVRTSKDGENVLEELLDRLRATRNATPAE